AQDPCPVVRGPARLQADPARRQLGEELLHLAAPQLTAQHRLLVLVNPVHLKDMLGGIQANPDNPHRAAPLAALQITAWHYDAVGGRPPNMNTGRQEGVDRQYYRDCLVRVHGFRARRFATSRNDDREYQPAARSP